MKNNQAKYPQLRFKGFTDPWEKRTLGQTTTKAKSYSLSRDVERDHETGYRYIHYGDIHTGVADIVTEHTKLPNIEPANYDELRVNDLVVADASEDYQGIAEPAVVGGLPTQHLVAGLHTITLRPSSANSLYLYYLLHTDSFKHFGYQMGTGLKVFGISWSNLSKFTFMIPSRPEQEMIVRLIESVDNLIAVNQRKLSKLKELKQGYLQKLFPKNGSKFPQLRFAGFADAWEQRKLGDIVVFLNGRAYKQAELLDSGKYPVLRVGNFNTNDKWYYSDLELPAKNYADKGDLLYTWATAFGPHIWKGPKVIYHYHIWKVETTSDISKNFAVHLLDADQAQMTNSLNGSTMVHITKGTMENKIVTIPGISEQRNMARLLDQLDCTIALHQRKLEKLQELKKGYLQKMFC
ncbi:restriction endonuclease subunit S [Lactiplantibacillus fabifermentans]|nr:restriction endonuclease subunit S [Lactiplantibacillus fabifermentans]